MSLQGTQKGNSTVLLGRQEGHRIVLLWGGRKGSQGEGPALVTGQRQVKLMSRPGKAERASKFSCPEPSN